MSESFKSVHWNRILILTMHYTVRFFAKAWNFLWLSNVLLYQARGRTRQVRWKLDIWVNTGTRLLLWLTLLCGYRAANRQRGFNQNLLTNEQLLQSCYYYFCITLKTTKNQRNKTPLGSQLTSRQTRWKKSQSAAETFESLRFVSLGSEGDKKVENMLVQVILTPGKLDVFNIRGCTHVRLIFERSAGL